MRADWRSSNRWLLRPYEAQWVDGWTVRIMVGCLSDVQEAYPLGDLSGCTWAPSPAQPAPSANAPSSLSSRRPTSCRPEHRGNCGTRASLLRSTPAYSAQKPGAAEGSRQRRLQRRGPPSLRALHSISLRLPPPTLSRPSGRTPMDTCSPSCPTALRNPSASRFPAPWTTNTGSRSTNLSLQQDCHRSCKQAMSGLLRLR